MNPWIPVILGVLGAGLSALAAYAVIHRQRSGRIATTEAETLWAEGQAMRTELRAETVHLREEVLNLRSEAVSTLQKLSTLREESIVTHAAMARLREQCAALTAEIIALRSQMADEQTSREKLTEKLDEVEVKKSEEEP